MATPNITMRIDEELKTQLQELVSNLGMDIPNAETKEAIEEVRQMKKNPSLGKTYTDVDEMMRELVES